MLKRNLLGLILFVLALFSSSSLLAQSANGLEKDELTGPVKSIKKTIYRPVKEGSTFIRGESDQYVIITYNSSGFQTGESGFSKDGTLGVQMTAKYDNNGNLIEQVDQTGDEVWRIEKRSYDKSGILLIKSVFEGDGSLDSEEVYTYDKSGNLTQTTINKAKDFGEEGEKELVSEEKNSYDKNGNMIMNAMYLGDGSLSYEVVKTYDKKDRLLQTAEYMGMLPGEEGEKELSRKSDFQYDEKDNVIREEKYEKNGRGSGVTEYNYDDNGNKIETKTSSAEGNLKFRMEHSYNKDRVEEMKGFTPDGKMMGIQRIDKNGKVIFIERYDADGNVIAKQKFDDHGNLNSKVKYQADGTETVEMVDLFEYDTTGNWINRVNFMRGNPIMIIGREIAYYE